MDDINTKTTSDKLEICVFLGKMLTLQHSITQITFPLNESVS